MGAISVEEVTPFAEEVTPSVEEVSPSAEVKGEWKQGKVGIAGVDSSVPSVVVASEEFGFENVESHEFQLPPSTKVE